MVGHGIYRVKKWQVWGEVRAFKDFIYKAME